MPKKFTVEYVRAAFEDCGYTPLFDSYTTNYDKLPFICINGHNNFISFKSLKKGHRCSECAGVRKFSLEVVQAMFESEGYTPLFREYVNAHKKLKFMCPKGHEHSISLDSWSSGNRCADCSGNKRLTFAAAKREFIKVGFTPLFEVYYNNNTPLKFKCEEGHTHKISLNSLKSGRGCGKCSGLTSLTVEEAHSRFVDAGLTPLFKRYKNSIEPLLFECSKGHEHKISVSNLGLGQRCGKCNNSGTSKAEKEVASIFKDLNIEVIENSRKIIPPYELDIYFPEKKVAIEYCGLYWHGENSSGKPRNYHYNKRTLCEELGIRLITIFDDEFMSKPEVVLSRISNALQVNQVSLYARKCEVMEISSRRAIDFLNINHLQGAGKSSIRFGIFFRGLLVGVLTAGAMSRAHAAGNKRAIELKRLCFLPGYSVVGAASRLLKLLSAYSLAEGFGYIKTYQDMRYGNPFTSVYDKLGFTLVSESKYTPHYIGGNYTKRYRNQTLRKTPEERLTGKTEWELRQEQGYDRIWDCGHRAYELKL